MVDNLEHDASACRTEAEREGVTYEHRVHELAREREPLEIRIALLEQEVVSAHSIHKSDLREAAKHRKAIEHEMADLKAAADRSQIAEHAAQREAGLQRATMEAQVAELRMSEAAEARAAQHAEAVAQSAELRRAEAVAASSVGLVPSKGAMGGDMDGDEEEADYGAGLGGSRRRGASRDRETALEARVAELSDVAAEQAAAQRQLSDERRALQAHVADLRRQSERLTKAEQSVQFEAEVGRTTMETVLAQQRAAVRHNELMQEESLQKSDQERNELEVWAMLLRDEHVAASRQEKYMQAKLAEIEATTEASHRDASWERRSLESRLADVEKLSERLQLAEFAAQRAEATQQSEASARLEKLEAALVEAAEDERLTTIQEYKRNAEDLEARVMELDRFAALERQARERETRENARRAEVLEARLVELRAAADQTHHMEHAAQQQAIEEQAALRKRIDELGSLSFRLEAVVRTEQAARLQNVQLQTQGAWQLAEFEAARAEATDEKAACSALQDRIAELSFTAATAYQEQDVVRREAADEIAAMKSEVLRMGKASQEQMTVTVALREAAIERSDLEVRVSELAEVARHAEFAEHQALREAAEERQALESRLHVGEVATRSAEAESAEARTRHETERRQIAEERATLEAAKRDLETKADGLSEAAVRMRAARNSLTNPALQSQVTSLREQLASMEARAEAAQPLSPKKDPATLADQIAMFKARRRSNSGEAASTCGSGASLAGTMSIGHASNQTLAPGRHDGVGTRSDATLGSYDLSGMRSDANLQRQPPVFGTSTPVLAAASAAAAVAGNGMVGPSYAHTAPPPAVGTATRYLGTPNSPMGFAASSVAVDTPAKAAVHAASNASFGRVAGGTQFTPQMALQRAAFEAPSQVGFAAQHLSPTQTPSQVGLAARHPSPTQAPSQLGFGARHPPPAQVAAKSAAMGGPFSPLMQWPRVPGTEQAQWPHMSAAVPSPRVQ
eukprot:TRINITY_DN48671_c0_g1_i1.p1 TRINITY_DN48671_c0_g1~~TRINITY_DN48671_c0_g1_i1.p1  ORF type:complete len:1129 (-),score=251.76 TRINITY_DN48671_c0_g1_i1:179-3103(-)